MASGPAQINDWKTVEPSDWQDVTHGATEAPKPSSWLDSVADYAKGVWSQVNPVSMVNGVAQATSHPIDTVKAIGASHEAVAHKAEEAFKRGDYAEGVRHAIGYLIPIVGPQIDAMGDKAGSGKLAEAMGEATGFGLAAVGPKSIASKVKSIPVTPSIANPNAAEAAAMSYLEGEGVPVSAAAKTGNAYVKGVQKLADSTPVGSYIAGQAQKATAQGLRDTANRLADRAHPIPVVAEQAGTDLRGALGGKAQSLANTAEFNYDGFRAIEKQTPIPTDISAIQAELKPIYDSMSRWMEPAKRNASAGFQAIRSIVEGPSVIPASEAEAGLGGLKALAREGDGRNAGIGKFITPKLQQAIDDAALTHGGQAALDYLQQGRKATAAQYTTRGVLDALRAEPVQAFGQMTYAKDAGVDLLRKVEREAPKELPKVGRAYLENLVGKATAQGGFDRAAGIWQEWQNLGPQTKKLLFRDPALVGDLDKFFLGAKKLAENPNPSGSGVIVSQGATGAWVFHEPMSGSAYVLGTGAISKMLHSPRGVQLLTQGMKIPLGNKAAGAAVAAQILKMAGDDAKVIEFPKAATIDRSQQSEPDIVAQSR